MLPTRGFFSPGVQVPQMTSMMTSSEACDIHPNENPGRKTTRSPQPEGFPGAYYVMYILLRCDLGSDDASRGGQSAVGWRWNRSGHISSSIEARDISLERSLQRDFRGVIWTGKCQVVNLYPADENPCQAV